MFRLKTGGVLYFVQRFAQLQHYPFGSHPLDEAEGSLCFYLLQRNPLPIGRVVLLLRQSEAVGRLCHQFWHPLVLRHKPRGNFRHHAPPLVVQQVIILVEQHLQTVVGCLCLLSSLFAARFVVALCHQELAVHLLSRLDPIAQHFEQGRAIGFRHRGTDALHLVGNGGIVLQPLLGSAVGKREVAVVQPLILGRIPLNFIAHILWLALPGQSVVRVQHLLEIAFPLLAKHLSEPLRLIAVGILITECPEVPCHVEKHLCLHLHRLDVAHVQQPVACSPRVVSLLQFLIHQCRSRGREPDVVVGSAQITQVVIHTSPTAP